MNKQIQTFQTMAAPENSNRNPHPVINVETGERLDGAYNFYKGSVQHQVVDHQTGELRQYFIQCSDRRNS